MPDPTAPRVFVSYSHDSPEHQDRVLALADRLRADGVDASIDQYEMLPPEGWPAWCDSEIKKADFVLMVCTETYLRRVDGEEEPGKGHGVLWEARLIRQELYDSASVSSKFVPILFDGGSTEHVPRAVKGATIFRVESPEGYDALYRLLTGQPRVRRPELGALRHLPERQRKSLAEPPGPEVRPQDGHADRIGGGHATTISNIPIAVPRHFMGREEPLAAIDAALRGNEGRVAITALHGLRGVGKTVLAVAYADEHRAEYRAIWWIRAETEPSLRADLVALGVRLGWVAADAKEEPALLVIMERLRQEGEGILLIFDNAVDADAIRPYLPRGGASRVIITSNAHTWRGVAEPVEILVWPKETGADYLIDRTGRTGERDAAEGLSVALGGLPLAHEQAGAYCERLDIPLAEYRRRFDAAPTDMLDTGRDAPAEYHPEYYKEHHDRLTVAKTFALAIDEAAKLRPAAEALILHAALLAPEPIPLYLFTEAREEFGEPLASELARDGLDEAVAALLNFALIDRETIADERDPAITIPTIRLHRLIREVAAARRGIAKDAVQRGLLDAMAAVYPADVDEDPKTWPRARQLDALALALVDGDTVLPVGGELSASSVMDRLASYRREALGTYALARPLFERALAIREKLLGPDHPDTATSLHNLAWLLRNQGEHAAALPLYERALAIRETVLGADHPDTARSLNNLATVLQDQGRLGEARRFYERALAIDEKVLGPEHPDTATGLNNLGGLLKAQGKLGEARTLCERGLAIYEKVLGPEHPQTATSLDNLAVLLKDQGKFGEARPLYERALAIREKALGSEHPDTATSLNHLAEMLRILGNRGEARPLFERALAIREKALGPEHPETAASLHSLALLRLASGNLIGARLMLQRAVAITEKAFGPTHSTTVTMRKNLAALSRAHQRR